MEYRRLGASGLKVSTLSFGSWLTLGDAVAESVAETLVQVAFDRGVNLFDTADVYNRGEGEKGLRRGISGLPRHHLVLATKCYFPMSDDVNDRGLSRKHITESLHRSLRRLGTDYVDLYQCHRPDPGVPLHETCRAMNDLIVQGKVLYWGVSAWPADRITEAVALCRQSGWHVPISNQPCYNLLDRRIERDVIPASERVGVGQIVYSPLAQGVLSGKYRPGAELPADSRAADERKGSFVSRFLAQEQLERVAKFVRLAEERDLTPVALALAFCLERASVASVIYGARTREQVEQNLQAVDVVFDAELAESLEELFPVSAAPQATDS